MTMRVTMLESVFADAGVLLAKGSTPTVSDAFGQRLVGERRASDTDGVLATGPSPIALAESPIGIEGTPGAGKLLRARLAPGWTVASWQWTRKRNAAIEDIAGANSDSYLQQAADKEYELSVRVTNLTFTPVGVLCPPDAAVVTVADTTAPNAASAQVANGAALVVAVTMSEALVGNAPAASAFAVSGKTVASVALAGSVVNLTLTAAVAFGETPTVSYTKPGSNPLQDAAGNQVASFGPLAITNNVAADTRPRFGYGNATAGVNGPQALFDSMTAFGSNGSVAGTFTTAPPSGQYAWAAFPAAASASGVHFNVTLGPGGWQGASSSGPIDDGGVDPNTSTVVWTDTRTGLAWRFLRTSFANAADTWTTS